MSSYTTIHYHTLWQHDVLWGEWPPGLMAGVQSLPDSTIQLRQAESIRSGVTGWWSVSSSSSYVAARHSGLWSRWRSGSKPPYMTIEWATALTGTFLGCAAYFIARRDCKGSSNAKLIHGLYTLIDGVRNKRTSSPWDGAELFHAFRALSSEPHGSRRTLK